MVVRSVERVRTRSGKVRYVVRDADGREFSTFRERIGEEAERYQGQRVHIEFHEEERAGFHNVYLDRIQPIAGGDAADTDPEEAAWRTAVEATPWLVGSGEPEREVPPEELFERLKPFKDRVADDIQRPGVIVPEPVLPESICKGCRPVPRRRPRKRYMLVGDVLAVEVGR